VVAFVTPARAADLARAHAVVFLARSPLAQPRGGVCPRRVEERRVRGYDPPHGHQHRATHNVGRGLAGRRSMGGFWCVFLLSPRSYITDAMFLLRRSPRCYPPRGTPQPSKAATGVVLYLPFPFSIFVLASCWFQDGSVRVVGSPHRVDGGTSTSFASRRAGSTIPARHRPHPGLAPTRRSVGMRSASLCAGGNERANVSAG
jgi:hypothetical protein